MFLSQEIDNPHRVQCPTGVIPRIGRSINAIVNTVKKYCPVTDGDVTKA
jgi:hypothetical protein